MQTTKTVAARLRALDFALAEAKAGVHEVGAPNRGPRVDQYQEADTLPGVGYAWCQAFQNWCWKQATGQLLAGGTASVGVFNSYAKQRGWHVSRPFRGDHILYDFGSGWATDHVGMIDKVFRLGPWFVVRTVEGNTSGSSAGSQSNGGGVYVNTRTVHASKVVFVRVPGTVTVSVNNRVPAAKLKAQTGYWAWLEWNLGESRWKGYAPRDPKVRPNVPRRIKPLWFARKAAFLAKRKAAKR